MKKLLIIITILSALSVNSQILHERRVYLFDNTTSMVTLGIWEEVKNNLIHAIYQIDDPTTEIVVVPFIDKVSTPWVEKATAKGKEAIIIKIKNATTGGPSTNISAAIREFYKTIDSNYVNYMFLMTDGKHNTTAISDLYNDLSNWAIKTNNNKVFGFYVMLHPEAHSEKVDQIISIQKNLWVVKTADVNVNIYKLNDRITYNLRNDSIYVLSVEGRIKDAGSLKVKLILEQNDYVAVEMLNTHINQKLLKFRLKPLQSLANLPEEINLTMKVEVSNSNDFSFVIPEEIKIRCINKMEKVLKIRVI